MLERHVAIAQVALDQYRIAFGRIAVTTASSRLQPDQRTLFEVDVRRLAGQPALLRGARVEHVERRGARLTAEHALRLRAMPVGAQADLALIGEHEKRAAEAVAAAKLGAAAGVCADLVALEQQRILHLVGFERHVAGVARSVADAVHTVLGRASAIRA